MNKLAAALAANPEAIEAQIAEHRAIVAALRQENLRLTGIVLAIAPRLEHLFVNADRVVVPVRKVRNECHVCGRRYAVDVKRCTGITCTRTILHRVEIEDSTPFEKLLFSDLTPAEWSRLLADFALGVLHVEESQR